MATRAYKEHRAATRPIREDGPEADGARRWAREVRGLTKAAGAPLRRCPAPGCFTITAALCCPTCRTVIAEPETDQGPELRRLHPAGPRYADYRHAHGRALSPRQFVRLRKTLKRMQRAAERAAAMAAANLADEQEAA